MSVPRKTLSEYLTTAYPFTTVADEAGYFVSYPDLPGCMTHLDRIEDVGRAAGEILRLWMETAYDQELEIPEPSASASYSGKFVLRLPRSLHRSLVESAMQEGVSLNQYATTLLAAGNAAATVRKRVDLSGQVMESPPPSGRTTSIIAPNAPKRSALRGTG